MEESTSSSVGYCLLGAFLKGNCQYDPLTLHMLIMMNNISCNLGVDVTDLLSLFVAYTGRYFLNFTLLINDFVVIFLGDIKRKSTEVCESSLLRWQGFIMILDLHRE